MRSTPGTKLGRSGFSVITFNRIHRRFDKTAGEEVLWVALCNSRVSDRHDRQPGDVLRTHGTKRLYMGISWGTISALPRPRGEYRSGCVEVSFARQ